MTLSHMAPSQEDGEAEVNAYLREAARWVDHEIQAAVVADVDDSWTRGAISYHLGWADASFAPLPPDQRAGSGKRLRPILAILSYQAAMFCRKGHHGKNAAGLSEVDRVLPFAAAVEFVHNFSLVHDDIEDGDRFRRGRPTLWSVCGPAQAINVGDTLHALAYASVVRLRARGVDENRSGALVAALAKAVVDMTIGQRRDMTYETAPNVDIEMYLKMIAGKTAALTACATFGGGLLALGPLDPTLEWYREFGASLGLGFQVRDDILGIWGLASDTGRPAGGDIRRRKKSLPVVLAYGRADAEARRRLRHLYAGTLELTDDDEADVRQILDECGAAELSQLQVQRHAHRAESALVQLAGTAAAIQDNPYLTLLGQLSTSLISRSR